MDNFKQIALDKEALLEGHFLLSSGLHSNVYFQCAKLLQWPEIALKFGAELKRKIEEELKLEAPDVVLAPAMGGLFIGHEVARAFGVRSVFLERVDGEFQLKRGFEIREGEKVLIIEDVFTTGKSTLEVIEYVQNNTRAVIVGVSCLASRLEKERAILFKEELQMKGIPHAYTQVLEIKAEAWTAGSCSSCKAGKPLVKPGSRKVVI